MCVYIYIIMRKIQLPHFGKFNINRTGNRSKLIVECPVLVQGGGQI